MRQWCEYWWKHIVYYGIINKYYWKFTCVLIQIVNVAKHIFHLQAYIFSSFCNIIILFIHLIRQFNFGLILIDKSRIIHQMIECNIKMFRNLLKQCNVSHLWIIIILIMIIYVDFILIEHLQFNSNTFVIINDIYNRVILVLPYR